MTQPLDALFASLPPGDRYLPEDDNRWARLVSGLEALLARTTPGESAALIHEVDERIAGWPSYERKAPESWWIDVSREEFWEYGVNSALGETRFEGFRSVCHPLFALARSAEVRLSPLSLADPFAFASFEANADLRHLEALSLFVPVGEPCLRYLMTSPMFARLKRLTVVTSYVKDKALLAAFESWRATRGLGR